jgi:hypothetical protein
LEDSNPNNPAGDADLKEKVERLTRELKEALDQSAATSGGADTPSKSIQRDASQSRPSTGRKANAYAT